MVPKVRIKFTYLIHHKSLVEERQRSKRMQASRKIEAGEKKLTYVTTSIKKRKESTEILRSKRGRQRRRIHELNF